MRDAGATEAAAKIFVILAVRDISEVDLIAPAITEKRAVLKSKLMASLFGNVVVGQIVCRDDAVIALVR